MTRVVVAGAIANKPQNGGEAWVRLSWVLGLARLGCEVYFVERIREASCVDARGRAAPFRDSANRAFFAATVGRFGLAERSALLCEDTGESCGLTEADVRDAAAGADLLVNISGHLDDGPVRRLARRSAYVDLDPGFTQCWHMAGLESRLAGHDAYFTVGANVGQPGCEVPTCGLEWQAVRQPVLLDHWPVAGARDLRRFTTVATWRGGFGPVEYGGRVYGLKVHEFRKYLDLPRHDHGAHFEVALDIHAADAVDRRRLCAHGWRLVDPRAAAGGADGFRQYVQGSAAEFSVAQGIYVGTASGWFSDRSARYLASGKPVLVQQTGFDRTLPVGEGLLGFRSIEEAADGARRVVGDYARHARAARRLAETYFDSGVVLRDFLARACGGWT